MKQTIRAIAVDFARTIAVDPVRENAVRARGGGAAGVTMVGLGILAFVAATLGVLAADRLAGLPIGPGTATLGSATTPGHAIGIPVVAYPALMSLLLVSTAVGTFGAVFAKRTLATLAVLMLLLPNLLLAGLSWRFRSDNWPGHLALPAVALIPVAVVVMRRVRARPALAQVVAALLAIMSVGASALAQIRAFTTAGATGGLALFGQTLEQSLALLGIVTAPIAILAGAGAISFARSVTGFLGRSIDRLAPDRPGVLAAITAVLTLVAAGMAVWDIVTAPSPIRWLVRVAVAALLLCGVVLWWRWATRRVAPGGAHSADDVEDGASTGGPAVALLLAAFTAPLSLSLIALTVQTTVTGSTGLNGLVSALTGALGHAWVGTTYATVAGVGLVVLAAAIARSHSSLLAAWLGVAGAVLVVLVQWNQWFAAPSWGGFTLADLARASALLLPGLFAVLAVRAGSAAVTLAAVDLPSAFATAALLVLILQGGFVADPFAPLLGFTGIGLVLFGVVWGFLTTGAHASVAGLAGLGRTAILIAYAVLSTTLLAWASATGASAVSDYSGGFGRVGSNVLGGALLAALIAAWVSGLLPYVSAAARRAR